MNHLLRRCAISSPKDSWMREVDGKIVYCLTEKGRTVDLSEIKDDPANPDNQS